MDHCWDRWNPGKGSGAMAKMDVGGATSSFGVWHEQIAEVKAIAESVKPFAPYSLGFISIQT
jgi:diaminopimelate decarboxylase